MKKGGAPKGNKFAAENHGGRPKLRDRVVLDMAIREAVAKLDPAFGYADSFDEASATQSGLIWAKAPPELMPETALLVRQDVALEHLRREQPGSAAGAFRPAERRLWSFADQLRANSG